jgi:hypothetical protein
MVKVTSHWPVIEQAVDEQDSECAYNVTLKRLRESMLTGKAINITYLCACVPIRVRACALPRGCVHVRACIQPCSSSTQLVWGHILTSFVAPPVPPKFFDIISNGMVFGKKLLNVKSVFVFSLQLLSKTFLILRKI